MLKHTTTIAAVLMLASAASQAQTSLAVYGQHEPHGKAAVAFIYDRTIGMWREQSPLTFHHNRYDHCYKGDNYHTVNPDAIIDQAKTKHLTVPDANCIMLSDLNNDGEITDNNPSGDAFFEHFGRGDKGDEKIPPYHVFWFDDNWLARYMAVAYARPLPNGLHDNGYPLRWRQMGGDNSYWSPYPDSSDPDRIALNGIYEINRGNFIGARTHWSTLKALSRATYVSADQRYAYPGIKETYHLALWAVLSERLLAASASFSERQDVLQHAMSLRSQLLSLQERTPPEQGGKRLGWRTSFEHGNTVMNTETTALSVLALGANAKWVLESGHPPLRAQAGNYFVRPHNALSAVVGLSSPGHMVYGPYWKLQAGTYDVDFSLRTPSNAGNLQLALVDVYDGTTRLASTVISTSAMPGNNEWLRHRLTASVTNPAANIEFRVYWYGNANLDVGSVRITKR